MKIANILAFATLVLGAGSASASTVQFSNNPNNGNQQDGTMTFSTTGIVSISGADISNVQILGGGASYNIGGTCGVTDNDGCLSLTSGMYMSAPVAGSVPGTYTEEFSNSGSNLSIVGKVSGVTGGMQTLYTGSFAGPLTLTYNTNSDTGSIEGSLDGGMLNGPLAAALGVPATTIGGTGNDFEFNIAFTYSDNTNSTVTGGSGTLSQNTIAIVPGTATPEPASLGLIGSGLIGLVFMRRKVRKS